MNEHRYTKEHEWVRLDGEVAIVGITAHAAVQLGDVVFVELPNIGTSYAQGEEIGVIESVKAASEVYAPISGEVLETNQTIADDPTKVNADPEHTAWFIKMKPTDLSELNALMDGEAYKQFCEGEGGK